jgi:hypothetical protein
LEIKFGVSRFPNSDWKKQLTFSKAKFLLLHKGMQLTRSLVSKHTKWEVHSGFISNTTLPLMRIGLRLGSQLCDWLLIGVGEGLTQLSKEMNLKIPGI